MVKIIVAEARFLVQNGEHERAESVILEIDGLLFYDVLLSKSALSKSKSELKDELLKSLILQLQQQSLSYDSYLNLLSTESRGELKTILNIN